MVGAMVDLWRAQSGREARPCSRWAVTTRCREKEKTTEWTRKRAGTSKGKYRWMKMAMGTMKEKIKGEDNTKKGVGLL